MESGVVWVEGLLLVDLGLGGHGGGFRSLLKSI